MQKLNNREITIEGLSLPKSIQIGISNRNDNGNNHIFENGEIKVLCSKCKKYHPVFRLENGQWIDINTTYHVSIQRDTKKEYFGTKCTKCYQEGKGKSKRDLEIVESQPIKEGKHSKKAGEYVAWSKLNKGVQQTIFLIPELDFYLRLYEVTNGIKKNELINQIIAEFKDEHPINY